MDLKIETRRTKESKQIDARTFGTTTTSKYPIIQCNSIEHSLSLYFSSNQIKSFYEFGFPEGNIRYLNYSNSRTIPSKNEIIIHAISLLPEHRNKQLWSDFLKHIVRKYTQVEEICICGMSNHLIEYATAKNFLLGKYWRSVGGDCVWLRNNNFKEGYLVTPSRLVTIKNRIRI